MRLLPRPFAALGLFAAFAVAALPFSTAAADTSDPAPTVSRSTVTAPDEYFRTAWSDPADFSNGADLNTTPRHMIQQGTGSISGGMLNLNATQQVFLLRSDPGSYPTTEIRDPRSRPLDAGRYRRAAIRLYSDRTTDAALFFRQCNSCANGIKYFRVRPDWHTYDLDMVGGNDLHRLPSTLPPVVGARWAGNIEMLWLITSFDANNLPVFQVDDLQLYEPTVDVTVTVPAGTGNVEVWMDTDNNPANDGTRGAPNRNGGGWFITDAAAGSTVRVPGGVLRAGETARFYTVRNGTRSEVSTAVTMPATSTPRPRVLSPFETQGDDWAKNVRRDGWDMWQRSDVGRIGNARTAFQNGVLHGWTAGPLVNDPSVDLTLGAPVDAKTYHKLIVKACYDGPWGLEDAPGGGMMARIVWHAWGQPADQLQVSDDLVVHTGCGTYVVELKTWPPTLILDPDGNPHPIGWGSGAANWIDMIRIDPHEDRGYRSWRIEDVYLMRNPWVNTSRPFDIRFVDDAWAPGTTAKIIADPNLNPRDPAQVVLANSVPVTAGVNTFRWNGRPTDPGTYFVRVELSRNGRTVGSYSTGQIDVSPTAAVWPPARGNGLVK